MGRTVITSKGRVTIPAELRKKLGLNPGMRVDWSKENEKLVLKPVTTRRAREVRDSSGPGPTTNNRSYAPTASCPPSGKKYCVPLIGSVTLRSNSCKSSLRSTKSMSEVLTISRSDDV
jgi:AbrB family looped-hinge helix DNA binding protein